MLSMTGFGKGEAALEQNGKIVVELGSVNRKQLEIRVMLPRGFGAFECDVRKYVQSRLSRGAVNVSVSLSQTGSSAGEVVNEALLLSISRSVRMVRRALGQSDEVDVAALASLPGVMVETSFDDAELALCRRAMDEALASAMDRLLAMRAAEGEALSVELASRRTLLEKLLDEIEPLTAEVPAMLRRKLVEKLEKENLVPAVDDERLLKELLFYADKADVSEEITRLRSHFGQFDAFLGEKVQPVGRSLDFLVQEMFREINTLGNKCSLPPVSARVVRFKSELEKLREQIQNIE